MKEPNLGRLGAILGMAFGWLAIIGIASLPFWELIWRRFSG